MKFSTASIIIASLASFANGKKLSSISKTTLKNVPTRRLQQEGCVLLLKQIIYEDHEEEQIECYDESTSQFVSLSAFESHILEMVKSGTIESGAATLMQEGAYFDDENRRLVLNGDAHSDSLTIEAKSIDHETRRRKLVTGTKSFLALRVEAADVSTSSTESEISDSWFGTSGDPLNFKSQMEACSYDKYQVVPASDATHSGGVASVTISNTVTGASDNEIVNAAITAASSLGSLYSDTDHIMVCVPPGTNGGWIAYAYVNSWLSVYNDQWCNYPSGQMHEIGHNIGLAHSGEDSTYDDQSGMMGYSYSNDDGPRMCFNGPKNAQLGWYDDKLQTISASGGSFDGNLYGISDYGTMPGTASVIVKITGSSDDWYVSYNKRSGINSGTVEGGNQVLVHKRASTSGYAESTLMAKLTAGQSYNADGIPLPVTVNNISTFAQVTIGTVTTSAPTTNPTSSPTASPTKAPTSGPTTAVTPSPSQAPTSSPTSSPSQAPTKAPTSPPVSAPTSAPSKAPTSSPTSAPTKAPTSAPVTPPPTSSPTSAPTSSPTSAPTKAPTSAPVAPPPTPSPTSSPTSPPVEFDCSRLSSKRGRCKRKVGCAFNRFTRTCITAPTTAECVSFNNKQGRCRKSGCFFNLNTRQCSGFYD
ncbi:hypothetical protein CTEN210_12642 [Chaetoceros tenuissimus]|uniref:Peptidase M11 gametolysin domain-containing protein n=1 Tax=Chaetoceros tenuissimus TaxID=426638 RepID=A0AAD3D3N3_9STRA|nr:hypothetical protein CTEN210_12642 [Chaetoceros tenuissimus]